MDDICQTIRLNPVTRLRHVARSLRMKRPLENIRSGAETLDGELDVYIPEQGKGDEVNVHGQQT